MRHFLRLAILPFVIFSLSSGQLFAQPDQFEELTRGFVKGIFRNLTLGPENQRLIGLLSSGGVFEDTDCDQTPGSSMLSNIQFRWNPLTSPIKKRSDLSSFNGERSIEDLKELIDSLGPTGKMYVNGSIDINEFITNGMTMRFRGNLITLPFSITTAVPASDTLTGEYNAVWTGLVLPLAIPNYIIEDDGSFKDYKVNENAIRLPEPDPSIPFWKISCNENESFCKPPWCDFDPDDSGSVHSYKSYYLKDFHSYLKDNFLDRVIPVVITNLDPEPISLNLNLLDRTPPRFVKINDQGEEEFLAVFPDCKGTTTGDFFKFDQITVRDNSSEPVKTLIALGYVNPTRDFNQHNWKRYEEWLWSEREPKENLGGPLNHVIMPHECHGKMRYSVFAWDKNRNLNPGEPAIVEDEPEICYGLHSVNENDYGYLTEEVDFGSLGRDPLTAKPFPRVIKPDLAIPEVFPPIVIDSQGNESPLDPARRIRDVEGNFLIMDNDFPNLMIKIQPVLKDEPAMFFPPPSGIDEPFFYTEFQDAYDEFVANAMFPASEAHLLEGTKLEYYPEIYDIKLANCTNTEKTWMLKWGVPFDPPGPPATDPDFIKKSFRMEHYLFSDTTPDGELIAADENSFGFRNGYGSDIVVFSSVPLIEDLEYEVSIYMEDNTKWINTDACQAKLVSGIVNGAYSIVIPNQAPPLKIEVKLPENDFETPPFIEPIKVVCREHIAHPVRRLDYEQLQRKYPYVQASVSDFAGNKRAITVFFSVSDEKTKITTIERRLNKNDD